MEPRRLPRAEGLSHCGACHTPRNLLGAEKAGDAYAGAVIDNWIAPPLTAANPAPVPWTQDELFGYLRNGFSDPAWQSPPGRWRPLYMVFPRFRTRTSKHSRPTSPTSTMRAITWQSVGPAVARAMSYASLGVRHEIDAAARLYTAACASCHYNSGQKPLAVRPDLALNSALNLSEPTNLIQVVLRGISAKDGIPGVVMPGFRQALGDADIARIAAYLRRTRTNFAAMARPRVEGRRDPPQISRIAMKTAIRSC